MLELHGGSGRVRLRLRALRMGGDLCVLLDGGDRAHTGAVALASADGTLPRSLSLPGHREDELARQIAADLSTALHVTVTVLCGIHINDITREEITLVCQTARQLAHSALPRLAALPADTPLAHGKTQC